MDDQHEGHGPGQDHQEAPRDHAHAAVRLQLLDGAFTYTDTGLLDRTHVRFFDRTEVTALFDDAGLTVLERLEVRREPHETEIPVDLDKVPAETLAQVTADPDARVFQWMLVAKKQVEGAEVDTTGLSTALLDQVTQLERAVRESSEHITWLETNLRSKTTESERVAELDRTLRERISELVEAHEALGAARAALSVKDDYIWHLQKSLGLPPDSPQVVPEEEEPPGRALGAHAAVDRLVETLDAHPKVANAARRAAEVARKARPRD